MFFFFYQATLKLLVHTDSTLDFFGLLNRKRHLNKMTELNNVIHIKSIISQKTKQEWESKQTEPWSGDIFLPVLMEKIPQVSSFLTAFWSVLVLAQCGH